MLRSYDTDNICIKNAAFSCDNALAAVTAWFAMAVNGFNPYAFGQW